MTKAQNKIENTADSVAKNYASLQNEIFKVILKEFQAMNYQGVSKDNALLWQARCLQREGLLVNKAVDVLAKYDGLNPKHVRTLLKRDGLEVMDEIDGALQKVTKKPDKPPTAETQQIIDAYINQTTNDLANNINETLLSRSVQNNSVLRAYRHILQKATLDTVAGLKTNEKAINDAYIQEAEQGLQVDLTDKGGKHWSMDTYANMVMRSTAHRIFNDVRMQRMKDFEQVTVLMSSHPNARPDCAYIQGKVLNIVPRTDPNFDKRYNISIYDPQYEYGEPQGTQGINCRHILFPFDPENGMNNQPQYDPKEAIKNGKLVQQQRARERAIRQAKERLEAAKMLKDTDAQTKAKTLIRARQKRLREFIKKTNRNNGKSYDTLTRDYNRESVRRK